jgi:hypothetical protein
MSNPTITICTAEEAGKIWQAYGQTPEQFFGIEYRWAWIVDCCCPAGTAWYDCRCPVVEARKIVVWDHVVPDERQIAAIHADHPGKAIEYHDDPPKGLVVREGMLA